MTGILIFNRHSAFVKGKKTTTTTVRPLRRRGSKSGGRTVYGYSRGRHRTSEASANHWVMNCFAISSLQTSSRVVAQSEPQQYDWVSVENVTFPDGFATDVSAQFIIHFGGWWSFGVILDSKVGCLDSGMVESTFIYFRFFNRWMIPGYYCKKYRKQGIIIQIKSW